MLQKPPLLFYFVIFWIGSWVFSLELASGCDLPYLGLELCNTIFSLSLIFLPGLILNCNLPHLPVAEITVMNTMLGLNIF
jgi:hypothetical protein